MDWRDTLRIFVLMKEKITIDFNVWVTQEEKARIDGKPAQYIRQRVSRSIKGETKEKFIETWYIPQLGITLVKKDG